MSAFVVEDKTIQTIVHALEIAQQEGNRFSCDFPSLLYQPTDILEQSVLAGTKFICQDILKMNLDAVNARYGGKTENEDVILESFAYRPDYFKRPDQMQVFKSLECLLYQCAEGDVRQRPLYTALNDYKNSLACLIVGNLPQYNDAKWG